MLQAGLNKLPGVLRSMGYDGLRAGQDKVVYSLLGGLDTICILPTGTGKSLCYTVPTLCNGWRTLIFSPLVALMRDQVQGLQRKGVAAAQISSTQTEGENTQAMKDWADGRLSFLFVAPERMENPMFKEAIRVTKPDMIAADEAHSISKDGFNFRPAYKKLGDFVRELNPRVVSAFSATLPANVELDVRRIMGLNNAVRLCYYPRRDNLILSSSDLESEMDIVDYVNKNDGTTLIYCSTVKRLEALCGTMQALCKEPIGYYHGQLPPAMKRATQDAFMEDKIRIMLATSAFGMGVDKGAVRHVLQRDIEGTIEATVQALGRGGRDGKETHCHTYYSAEGLKTQKFFLNNAHPSIEQITSVYDAIMESSDDMGRCYCSMGQLSKQTGVYPMALESIINILRSDNVIQRSKEKATVATVKYLTNYSDTRFDLWKDAVMEGGTPNGDQTEVEIDWLAEKLGLTGTATVKKWMKQWEQEGLLVFTPPRAWPPIEVIGSLQNVDFNVLTRLAKSAVEKLKDVLEYCDTPDNLKHAFIEERFGIQK